MEKRQMSEIEKIILCNVEESEFYPSSLDCAKYPSRVYRCLEGAEKKLGIKCCGLCEHWVDPKPTENEKLIAVCVKYPTFGTVCYAESCKEFRRRDPKDFDEENFDLSELNKLLHTSKFNKDDDQEVYLN